MNNPVLPETQETVRKSNRFLWIASALTALIIVAAVSTYVWVYLFNPCEVEAVKEASSFLISQLKTYDGQYQFTATVYRSGLNSPMYKLQQIFMDTQAVAVPVCMQTAKNELLNYMGTVIRAFRAFAAGEAESAISSLLQESDSHYDNFNAEMEAVNKCAPFCIP